MYWRATDASDALEGSVPHGAPVRTPARAAGPAGDITDCTCCTSRITPPGVRAGGSRRVQRPDRMSKIAAALDAALQVGCRQTSMRTRSWVGLRTATPAISVSGPSAPLVSRVVQEAPPVAEVNTHPNAAS